MKEAIARSKTGKINFTLMTTATINNKYLSNVRAFFEWAAVVRGALDGLRRN